MLVILALTAIINLGFFLLDKFYSFAGSPAELLIVDRTQGILNSQIIRHQLNFTQEWNQSVLFIIFLCLILTAIQASNLRMDLRSKQDVFVEISASTFIISAISCIMFWFTSQNELICSAVIKQGSKIVTFGYNSHVISEYMLQLSSIFAFLFIASVVVGVFLPRSTEQKI